MKPGNPGAAAMQQVTDWLEKVGLGQYAQRSPVVALAHARPRRAAGSPERLISTPATV